MSVLEAEGQKRLKIGIPLVDDLFPGLVNGDFAVICGNEARLLGFILCVRCVSPSECGGLDSDVVFIDGGNCFNPYVVAEVARGFGVDPRAALERIHISRAFTAYQLSALILERLEKFLEGQNADLIFVSDIAMLFMDKDVPRTEAHDLFLKVCHKLAYIAKKDRKIVLATYQPDKTSRRGLFFDAALLGQTNVLIEFERKSKFLKFVLKSHQKVRPFELEIPTGNVLLTSFMGV
ncbi:MAG: hypothetical protein QXQ50_03970 [Candidatus Bathyarchaeia archaeon]